MDISIKKIRSDYLNLLSTLVEGSIPDAKTSNYHKWLCHIIMADIEEFFIDPFGPCLSMGIPAGPYSNHGYGMIKRTVSNRRHGSWTCVLDNIIDYVSERASCDILQILGLKKSTDGVVCNCVNGRPFSGTDVEHYLCKMWMVTRCTFTQFRYTRYPQLANGHTHPHPSINSTNCQTNAHLCMEQTLKTFERSNVSLPIFCQVNDNT
jgi:hypothetical protein